MILVFNNFCAGLYSKYLLVLSLLAIGISSKAQLVTTNNAPYNTVNYLVQNVLMGNGITASGITFIGNPNQLGYFDGSNSNLGLSRGIFISTGNIATAQGANISGTTSDGFSGPGYPDLDLITSPTLDAAIIDFYFVPIGDSVKFRYIFASEEYNEFTCSQYNDVFAFFISGPGYSGPYSLGAENIALIPGTTTPVAINSINQGFPGDFGANMNCTNVNPNYENDSIYYFDNDAGTTVEFDGFTRVLEAKAYVQCGETYRIRMAVADGYDDIYNSGVFLEAESFSSPGIQVDVSTVSGDTTIVEGCAYATLTFTRPTAVGDQIVGYEIAGSAINGSDYDSIPPFIIIPDGQYTGSISVVPIPDTIPEILDTVQITVYNITECGDTIPEIAYIIIQDLNILNVNATDTTLSCPGDLATLNVTTSGGTPEYIYTWSNGMTGTPIMINPLVNDTLIVQSFDDDGCVNYDTSIVIVNPLFTPNAGNDSIICTGLTTLLGGSGSNPTGPVGSTYNWTPSASLNDPLAANPIASPAATTMYYVDVTNSNGCTIRDSILITVANEIPLNAGPNTAICIGSSINLNASGGINYAWFTNPSLSDTSVANPIATPVATTTYYVTENSPGSCWTLDSVEITVLDLPVFDLGNDTTICPNTPVEIGEVFSGIVDYLWSPSTYLSNPITALPLCSATDTITYTLTAVDTSGCVNTDNITINVFGITPSVVSFNDSICFGDSTELIATGTGIFEWLPAALVTSISNDTTIAFPLATSDVTLITTDPNSCKDSLILTIEVLLNPVANAGNDVGNICPDSVVQLQASGGISYLWSPATLLNDANISNPLLSPVDTVDLEVLVTDQFGCSATDSIRIIVNLLPSVFAGNDTTICPGTTISIGEMGSGFNNYSWVPTLYLNDPFSASPLCSATDTITYIVTVSDTSNCVNSDTITVNTFAIIPSTVSYNDSVCFGDSSLFVASGIGTFEWLSSAQLSSSSNDSTWAISTSSTNVLLVTTDPNTCNDTLALPLDILINPTANAGDDISYLCPGSSVQLNASGGLSYLWSPSTDLDNPNINNPIASPIDTTYLELLVTDQFGCTDLDSLTIIVNTTPPAMAGNDTTICLGDTISIGGNPTSATGSLYNWTPTLSLINNTAANPLAFPTGATNYVVYITNDTCTNRDSITVNVLSLPVPNAYNNVSVCEFDSVQLYAENGISYVWTPGNFIANANSASPMVSPPTYTTYYVMVTDANGCVNFDSTNVEIWSLPVISINGNDSICLGNASPLTASGATSYLWTPSTGLSNSSLPNPIASPTTTQNYLITGTDDNGCINTSNFVLTVLPLPTPEISMFPAICLGDSIEINATGGGTYSWFPAALFGQPGSGTTYVTAPNTQMIYVLVTDQHGCQETDSATLTVNELPTLTLSNEREYCIGDSLALQISGANNYLWQPAAILSDTSGNLVYVNGIDSSWIYVIGTDLNYCSTSDSVFIVVNPLPYITNNGPHFICRGDIANLVASGAENYLWTPDLYLDNNNQGSVNANPDTSIYYVVLGIDSNNCANTDTAWIEVFRIGVNPDTTICLGDSIFLVAYGSPATSYSWTPDLYLSNSDQDSTWAKPLADITYSLNASDLAGCSDATSVNVLVNQTEQPDFEMALAPSCDGMYIRLINLSSPNQQYVWNLSDGTIDPTYEFEFLASYNSSQIVSLALEDNNGCSLTITKDTIIKSIDEYFSIAIPNVFTPNMDGMNDLYYIDIPGKFYECTNVSIFNRWGQLLFKSFGSNMKWDGRTDAGVQCNPGIYFVTIEIGDYTFHQQLHLLDPNK